MNYNDTFGELTKHNGDVYDYHTSALTLETLVGASEATSVMVHDIVVQKDCISFKIDGCYTGAFVWSPERGLWLEYFQFTEDSFYMTSFATIEQAAANLVLSFEDPYH